MRTGNEGFKPMAAEQVKQEEGFGEMVKIIFQAVLIAVVIRSLLFEPFTIPSGSMIPTLVEGDFIFGSKYSYGYSRYSFPFQPPVFEGRALGSEPKRGDVLIFFNVKKGQNFIKRVIGMPGETVQLIQGRVYINGQLLPRKELSLYNTVDDFGRPTRAQLYEETLPSGRTHVIMERYGDQGSLDNTGVYTVPEGHYFMMGDNRDNSTDSRVLNEVGYVAYDTIVARAEVVALSFENNGQPWWAFWTWPFNLRTDRLFKGIS
jgi:signal peptidase I